MEIPIYGKKELVCVSDNIYNATVSGIREVTYEYGPTLIVNFKISDGPFVGKEVNGLCAAIMTSQSKLWKWCVALGLAPVEGQKLNTDTLIGRKCRVLTKTKQLKPASPGDVPSNVSNVAEVLPPA
jgi:hypothetical protein